MRKWDPDLYLRFERERTIPSRDLAARVDLREPRKIVDIRCGPGNSTSVLRDAWPDADIVGLDNSEEMIKKARAAHPGYNWILADAEDWRSNEKCDLVFSNATLHWIADHEKLLGNLFERIEDEGALAAQVPFNVDSPLYEAIVAVSQRPRWKELMKGCGDQIFCRDEAYYYDLLSRLSKRIDLWTTTYVHIMESHESLLEWYSSTGLKTYLEQIENEEGRAYFKTEILEACKGQYPVQRSGKILFPFRRVFFVAYKGTSET